MQLLIWPSSCSSCLRTPSRLAPERLLTLARLRVISSMTLQMIDLRSHALNVALQLRHAEGIGRRNQFVDAPDVGAVLGLVVGSVKEDRETLGWVWHNG